MEARVAPEVSVDEEELRAIAVAFKCPSHLDKPLTGFCMNDRTFGCEDCIKEKPISFTIYKLKSATHAEEIIERLFQQPICAEHHEKPVLMYCRTEQRFVCLGCVPLCSAQAHEIIELEAILNEARSDIQTLSELLKQYQEHTSAKVDRLQDFEETEMDKIHKLLKEKFGEKEKRKQIKALIRKRLDEEFRRVGLLRREEIAMLIKKKGEASCCDDFQLINLCQETQLSSWILRLTEAVGHVQEMEEQLQRVDVHGIMQSAIARSEAEELMQIGLHYKNISRFKKAIEFYNRAIDIDPTFPEVHNNKGIAYKKQGYPDKALSCHNKAISLNPHYAKAYTNRGNAYFNLGNPEEALKDYTKSLSLDPTQVKSWKGKGNVMRKMGKLEEALECYNRALEIDAKFGMAIIGKGRTLVLMEHYEEAEECFDVIAGTGDEMAGLALQLKTRAGRQKLEKHRKEI
eukprot:CAMPEP_0114986720 /NCGR_PEP_ID=MMETSP0216-20121206/8585_1 /TAXON_ID=223996 /ORGANISM="Protocruzia adherens, Strain Boccale" /LENGTH=458 /DNA_ID=CAMNT_0002349191 /DNA_START=6 /DNA_END=1382 /DNA_ORIENTATION=+